MGGDRPNRHDAEDTERSPELERALDAAQLPVSSEEGER